MKKIMSGGQTGADRGALEAARGLEFPYGGWVPLGRRSEDGKVPAEYDQLTEHENPDYKPRTRNNVRDSDGTLIICPHPMTPGSKVTLRFCREQEKVAIVRDAARVKADPKGAAKEVWAWVQLHKIGTLNVAGSRESKCKGLQEATVSMTAHLIDLARGRRA